MWRAMPNHEELTYSFLAAHPADAARVLERLLPDSAAAFLQTAPLRLAAPVLREMLPFAGARCLERIDDDDTVGLLRGVGAQAGVALLRYFTADRRERLLRQLPATLTVAFELLLGYPEGAVGAWADPHALAFPADLSAGDAIERVRRAEDSANSDPFVIDRNQRLTGFVTIGDLLRADATTPLARLLRPSPHRIPALSRLASLREHPGWRSTSSLPVVDRGEKLIGALTYAALHRALSLEQSQPATPPSGGTLAGVASTYWIGVAALIQAVIGWLPVERSKEDV